MTYDVGNPGHDSGHVQNQSINQSITHNLPVIGTDIHPTMYHYNCSRGRRDRMVVGCTTT